MLIYIAILSIVIVALSSFLVWVIRSDAKTSAMKEVLDNSKRVMEIIAHELRGAKSIYGPTSTSSQLSLETLRYFPEGESSSFADFYMGTSTIFLKKESQDPIAITSDMVEVKKLVFTQISATSTNPSIQISLEIEYKNPSNRPEYEANFDSTTTISLRSY